MIKRFFYSASLFILAILPNITNAALELIITDGVNLARPIAIAPFTWNDHGYGQDPFDIAAVVASDLQNSGKFAPIERSKLPAFLQDSKTLANGMLVSNDTAENVNNIANIPLINAHDNLIYTQELYTVQNFNLLANFGADALLVGSIERNLDTSYSINYKLIDLVRAKLSIDNNYVLFEKNITIKYEQMREYAHRISDLVYQELTGEKGAFRTKIAYVVIDENEEFAYQLKIADYDGFNERTLLSAKAPLMSPSWSPDGSKIAYVSFQNQQSEIFIIDIYTGDIKKITSYPRHNGAPQFSPDGKKLALVLSQTGYLQVYVLDLRTKEILQITQGNYNNTEPFWFADGQSLIFTSDRGGNPQIYQVSLNSKQTKRITWEGRQNLAGQLTPNNETLVMINKNNRGFSVAKQHLETKAFQLLTKGVLDESLSIAPNGSMVVYSSIYEGKNILAMVSIDGRFKASIATINGRVKSPAWSPFLN